MKKNEISLKDALSGFVNEKKIKTPFHQVKIEEIWANEMGKTINNYTTSLKLRKHTLYIEVNSSPLRQELSYSKDKIIEIINKHLNKELIKTVVIR